MDLIKINNFMYMKENYQLSKKANQRMVEMFANDMFDKRLMYRIQRTPKTQHNKTHSKNEQRM